MSNPGGMRSARAMTWRSYAFGFAFAVSHLLIVETAWPVSTARSG